MNDTELLPAILEFAKGYIKVCDKEIERLTAGRDVQKDNARRWETLALQYKRQLESLIADNAELKSRVEELEAALQKIRTEPGNARDCRYIAGQELAASRGAGLGHENTLGNDHNPSYVKSDL